MRPFTKQQSRSAPNNLTKYKNNPIIPWLLIYESLLRPFSRRNKSNALQKKRKCCDKTTYTVQRRPNCTVVSFNTASFKFFREILVTNIENNHEMMYTVSHTPQTDQMNNITQDILRITNNTTSAPMYTINTSPEQLWIQVGEQIIWESMKEKLLGVTIDKNLLFNHHVQGL